MPWSPFLGVQVVFCTAFHLLFTHIDFISGVVGTHRFCSSRDMGDQCQDIWFPDHDRMYRACVYTCSGDGCNSATRTSTLPAVLVSLLWLIVHVWRRLWWVRVVGVGEDGELGLHLGWIGAEVEPGWVGMGWVEVGGWAEKACLNLGKNMCAWSGSLHDDLTKNGFKSLLFLYISFYGRCRVQTGSPPCY